ncbi:hypothetical protein FGO68_gene9630 [Halteria grandinella]|uniref:Elongation factor 2 n=1 Tax=Halteria grandinella TaxID=5974 RepID=A0A8J8P0J6_HALGN|nr:hypothetical protein FGO68_gene9630 [Halteria grandinella]
MSELTSEQLSEAMHLPSNIRHVVIIGQQEHGKSTILEQLIETLGFSLKDHDSRYYTSHEDHYRNQTQAAFFTNNVATQLFYTPTQQIPHKPGVSTEQAISQDMGASVQEESGVTGKGYLINVIKARGYYDSPEGARQEMRLADGVVIVVDYGDGGLGLQAQMMLRQAVSERIKPVLFINKIDKGILEHPVDGETMYQRLRSIIESANSIVASYQAPEMGESLLFNPANGNVAFGSALFGWGFTLNKFANVYSQKLNIEQDQMINLLWGDNYFNTVDQKWTKSPSTIHQQRSFVHFILDPLTDLFKACVTNQIYKIGTMLSDLGIPPLTSEEQRKNGKHMVMCVFKKWIGLAECMGEIIVRQLPSPLTAQQYRAVHLYEGPIDDPCGQAMQICDPEGPLMVYISKVMIRDERQGSYAFGRVFSGVVSSRQKVRIIGPHHVPATTEDIKIAKVADIQIVIRGKQKILKEVPCGNLVILTELEKHIKNQATISNHEEAYPFRGITKQNKVTPVVCVSVQPKNAHDLPKLIMGLKELSKQEGTVLCSTEDETGENFLSGSNVIDIERSFNNLRDHYAQCELMKFEPFVIYKETVTALSSQQCKARSQNKHNIIFMQAEPLGEALTNGIENNIVISTKSEKDRISLLSEKYGWDANDAAKVWCFGPESTGPNLLVDKTQSVQSKNEIKEKMEAAFQWATKEGPLIEESVRGVRFNIIDATLHADAIHRGGGQIIPLTRRLCYGALLTAQPRLVEPIYSCEITICPIDLDSVLQIITLRQAIILSQEPVQGTSNLIVKFQLPVAESFGIYQAISQVTQGRTQLECQFDHWQAIESDPLDPTSKAGQLVAAIRKRKGLKEGIPPLSDFIDVV